MKNGMTFTGWPGHSPYTVTKPRQANDQRVTRIDLQDRLGSGLETAGAAEDFFELAVRPEVGRHQADRALGQPF